MADTGYTFWNKEIDRLKDGKSKYEWDELEELITDVFEDENIVMKALIPEIQLEIYNAFDKLMEKLMEQEM